MGIQITHSPAEEALRSFVERFCRNAKVVTDPFVGFEIGNTVSLFKKGGNYIQRTGKSKYPVVRFDNSLCPTGLVAKPARIVFQSTDSRFAKDENKIGEKFFEMPVPYLEKHCGKPIDSINDLLITLTAPRRQWFLDMELSADELKMRLADL